MDWFHSLASISAAELRALPRHRHLTPLIRILYENTIREAAAGKRMYVGHMYKRGQPVHGGVSDAFQEFLGAYDFRGMKVKHIDAVPPEQIPGLRLSYGVLTEEQMARLPEFLALVKAELGKRLPDCTLIPVCTESKAYGMEATLTITW